MSKLTFRVLSFFSIILSPGATFASELQSLTTSGSGILSEELTYQGETASEDSKKKEGSWNWSLDFTYTTVNLTTTGSSTADHTSSFRGGLGYSNHWEIGADYTYSTTPEEALKNYGPSLYLGYTFEFDGQQKQKPKGKPKTKVKKAVSEDEDSSDDTEEAEPFKPTLNFKLTAGSDEYSQSYSSTPAPRKGSRRPPAPKVLSQSIHQNQLELSSTFSALEWFDIKISGTRYFYDKDVTKYLANLDTPRAILSGAATFGSTLSGFSSDEAVVDLTFHLPLDFDLEPEASQSTSASDGTKTNTLKATLTKTWSDTWKTGIGYEHDHSPTESQNLIIATVAYEF